MLIAFLMLLYLDSADLATAIRLKDPAFLAHFVASGGKDLAAEQ